MPTRFIAVDPPENQYRSAGVFAVYPDHFQLVVCVFEINFTGGMKAGKTEQVYGWEAKKWECFFPGFHYY